MDFCLFTLLWVYDEDFQKLHDMGWCHQSNNFYASLHFFFQFLSFNCKWQISKDITYINNNYGPQFLRVFWTKNLRITALEHFRAYSIHTVRPLRANNYKIPPKRMSNACKKFQNYESSWASFMQYPISQP